MATKEIDQPRAVLMRAECSDVSPGRLQAFPRLPSNAVASDPLIAQVLAVIAKWASYDGEMAARIAAAQTPSEREGAALMLATKRSELYADARAVEDAANATEAQITAERESLLAPPSLQPTDAVAAIADMEVRRAAAALTDSQCAALLSEIVGGKHRATLEALARGPAFDAIAKQARAVLSSFLQAERGDELAHLDERMAHVEWRRTVAASVRTATMQMVAPLPLRRVA